ncbi:MAG: hypothetical protein P0S94_01285, partial [Simkaniaceae bacterium]|nr:hypothetical protein [Simkaniaceae bacterium]
KRKTFWDKITISSNGDMRMDTLHPSLSNRIKNINIALFKKGCSINHNSEKTKIDSLTIYTTSALKLIQKHFDIAYQLRQYFSDSESD